ncbi:MAG: DUF308 domain-containing protein [Victivallaceae bacterium]
MSKPVLPDGKAVTGAFINSFSMKNSLLRGILMILVGLIFALAPLVTITMAIKIIGVIVAASALTAAIMIFNNPQSSKAVGVFFCLIAIVGALIAIFTPVAEMLLVIFIGMWLICTGIWQSVNAFSLKSIPNGTRWVIGLGGVITFIVGGIFIFSPRTGLQTLGLFIGLYIILYGMLQIVIALLLRKAVK